MVTGAYHPELSGAGLQCRHLIRALGDRARCRVLTTSARRGPTPAMVDGVPVHRVFVDVGRRRSRARAGAALAAAFLRLAARVDIVHFHGFSRKSILLMPLATALHKRCVLKLTSVGHDDPEAVGARGPLARFAYGRADAYVGVSPRQRQLYRASGLPEHRFVLIPNGVDTERFHPASPAERAAARRALGLPAELPLVLFVGFFSKEKQPDVLFEAWRRLAQVPSGLVYVGATRAPYYEVDPGLAEAIRAGAAAAGCGDRVWFVESAAAIELYYRAADVFALPSSREGLPNALLEAMAGGLACVASRLPGITDWLFDDAESGVLVPSGDPSALAEALARLLGAPALRARLGGAARATAASRFSLATAAEGHLHLYDRLRQG
jgi:glycosyltransferase involved in cell wall biosynthesis